MDIPNHHANPEVWFRPSPALSFPVLFSFLERQDLTATLRLGRRDAEHPKGYIPGTVATLRLYDDARQERLTKRIRITRVASKPLRDFASSELSILVHSPNWQSAQQELAFFEGRPVALDETVSIIEFAYLNQGESS